MSVSTLSARLTRRSRSNFYYAFLTLPRPQREALYAVYAFCRTVDDVADLGGDTAAQYAALARWRQEVERCYTDGPAPEHPIARQLASAVRQFGIPRGALEAIVDGCAMDLARATYETIDDLLPYCYRVASAVGLCCIEIFGYRDPRARRYAVHLGLALQLTNILRDVGADAGVGRVYLPQADLRQFGVTIDDLRSGRYSEQFVRLMFHEANRARDFYRDARHDFPVSDARSLVPAEIMGRTYFALLREIERRRFRVFQERVTVPAPRKLSIALRVWATARLGRLASQGWSA